MWGSSFPIYYKTVLTYENLNMDGGLKIEKHSFHYAKIFNSHVHNPKSLQCAG